MDCTIFRGESSKRSSIVLVSQEKVPETPTTCFQYVLRSRRTRNCLSQNRVWLEARPAAVSSLRSRGPYKLNATSTRKSGHLEESQGPSRAIICRL
jgi:hypothetical protein